MRAEEISFASGGGVCRGALYRPEEPGDDVSPVVVIAHGMSATRLTQYDRRARRLVEAGIAVLDFDPRYVGMSSGEPRQRISPFDWLDDLRAAVAYVRGRSDIDQEAVGLYGSSLGGALAFAVAAEDPVVRALALDVPSLDGLRATPSPVRSRPALAAAILRDVIGRRRGRPPVVLTVFGDVGSGAVVQHDVDGFWRTMSELDGIEWVEPRHFARHRETGEWRNEATALELLGLLRFRPSRRAAEIRCPVLAHLAEDDRVVPFKSTLRVLERLPLRELHTIRGGHFAPFHGQGFETTVQAQIEFFARHLRGSSRRSSTIEASP